ncbi:aspartoacylase [Endozoicomonadaceae bacterium StTr2]
MQIKKITLSGGTHGNEFIGPYLIRKLQNQKSFKSSLIPVDYLLSNPEAFKKSIRFIDSDLNRSFSSEILQAQNIDSYTAGYIDNYEHQRAREINDLLGPKPVDDRFIIDLHSTTSNMGMTLIVREGQLLNLQAAAFVQQAYPEVRIIVSDSQRANGVLNSISHFGLAIEVGPTPNGVIRQDLFDMTEQVIHKLVEFLQLSSEQQASITPDELTVYQSIEKIPYPTDSSGNINAMVHQNLQDRDFEYLEPGELSFYTFEGKELPHTGQAGFPIFINEAAYYYEKVAYVMTRKQSLKLIQ